MRPNQVFVAPLASTSFSTAIGIIEIQAAAQTMVEVLRAWVGPAEGAAPVDEIQEIGFYTNDTFGTGTVVLEQQVQGGGDGAIDGNTFSSVTIGTTPVDVFFDSYHTQNGWLYLPAPEERYRIMGGAGGQDTFGMHFPVAPDAAMTVSAGIVFAIYN